MELPSRQELCLYTKIIQYYKMSWCFVVAQNVLWNIYLLLIVIYTLNIPWEWRAEEAEEVLYQKKKTR